MHKMFKFFTGAVFIKFMIFTLYRLHRHQLTNDIKNQKNIILENLKKSEFNFLEKNTEKMTYLAKIESKNQKESDFISFLAENFYSYKGIEFQIKKVFMIPQNKGLMYNLLGYDYQNHYFEFFINLQSCCMQQIEPIEFAQKICEIFDIKSNIEFNFSPTQTYQNYFAAL